MSEAIRTAFDAVQRNTGAEFMEWEGWYWTTTLGDAMAEHEAVRKAVGVWDESPLRKWDFRGPDALRAADRIFTNDMLGLKVGQVRYAPFCDEDGKMVGDGTVLKFSDDHAFVITALDADLDHFRAVTRGLNVGIEPITEQLPHIQLQGPRAPEMLARLCDRDVSELHYFHFWPEMVNVGGVPTWVSRTGYSGELGYEIFCRPEHADRLWAAVTGSGARPYGLSAVETLRIESALIFIGYDYFQHQTNPFDMSLDKVIRLDTGDFNGKKALMETAKQPPRRLVTLVVEGDAVPEYGARVTVGGEVVGTLTSPCLSPTLGRVIGLAVIETGFLGSTGGKELNKPVVGLSVPVGEGSAAAAVASLPIYDPQKTRPRASPVAQPAQPA